MRRLKNIPYLFSSLYVYCCLQYVYKLGLQLYTFTQAYYIQICRLSYRLKSSFKIQDDFILGTMPIYT